MSCHSNRTEARRTTSNPFVFWLALLIQESFRSDSQSQCSIQYKAWPANHEITEFEKTAAFFNVGENELHCLTFTALFLLTVSCM